MLPPPWLRANLEISNLKKYADHFCGICIENSDFGEGIFAQIPPSPEGILKIPEGTPPGPRAGAEAGVRRENPRTDEGIWPKIHETKSEFWIYFFLFVGTHSKIAYILLSNLHGGGQTPIPLPHITFFFYFRRKEFLLKLSFLPVSLFTTANWSLIFFSSKEETWEGKGVEFKVWVVLHLIENLFHNHFLAEVNDGGLTLG